MKPPSDPSRSIGLGISDRLGSPVDKVLSSLCNLIFIIWQIINMSHIACSLAPPGGVSRHSQGEKGLRRPIKFVGEQNNIQRQEIWPRVSTVLGRWPKTKCGRGLGFASDHVDSIAGRRHRGIEETSQRHVKHHQICWPQIIREIPFVGSSV